MGGGSLRCGWGMLWIMLAGCAVQAAEGKRELEYEVGGPLAGVKLPRFPTQHGEQPGQPGALPGQYDGDLLAPQVELNPGSVENYRHYWFKYTPCRSMFDRQSLLRQWIAPEIPGAQPTQVEQCAAPLYYVPRFKAVINTGLKNRPVAVVRCKVGSPVIGLDLGELERGMYAIRVIGAVPTEQLRAFREPLYLRATINDGLKGESLTYRLRLGYVDEFYSIAEIYFHAVAKRVFHAELAVDHGSKVDLLVQSLSLDDALIGHERRAIKTHTNLFAKPPVPDYTGKPVAVTPQERLARDAAIWESLPPINKQGTFYLRAGDEHVMSENVFSGAAGKTAEQIEADYGKWQSPGKRGELFTAPLFLQNQKLNLQYSVDDLRHNRLLPAPYPFQDDGAGLYFPEEKNEGQGMVWAPIAEEVARRIHQWPTTIHRNVMLWRDKGDRQAARDAAMAMVRYAYNFPALDMANQLVCLIRDPGPYGREYRARRRETVAFYLPGYSHYVNLLLYDYDRLFDYLQQNQEVAESVGRFVPWVRAPRDVIELLDIYLAQTVARRILRYHYVTDPVDIANAASVLGDRSLTDPWMEWLFARTFIYPLPPVGIQDAMITGCERDGCEYVGSAFYSQAEGASRVAASLEQYLRTGGNPQYNLTDQARYPKPVAHCYWRLKNVVAGWDFLRIGDVTGPDKSPGLTLRDLQFARRGWQWTADPKFAFMIKHYLGRENESEQQWAQIETAAARLKRAPWLDNRSRVLPMWAGVLEGGLEHDDPRLRRAAYLRVGMGIGHEHSDTLDLQVVAHGQPATIDGGQRGGYSSPADNTTRVHNLVEVNSEPFRGHSWVKSLADTPGARYLHAAAKPPADTSLFARQIALVDVDEGRGGQPLSIQQQLPGAKLPGGVTPANAYVFDVFRVAGGKTHTYCFHGALNDQFDWNVPDAAPVSDAESPAGQYLRRFKNYPEKKAAGTAPDTLEATWRQLRTGRNGSQQMMLRRNYEESLPDRFTRLHLLGVANAQAMRAQLDCFQWKYNFTCLMVQRAAENDAQESAFAAIIEPYLGQPCVKSTRLLAIPQNQSDARRALAVEVKLAAGRTDICFADGRPELVRSIPDVGLTVAAEFACYASDAQGLCAAVLAGGTLLEGPGVKLCATVSRRSGKVIKADYLAKAMWIDQSWPAQPVPLVLETGLPGHRSSYTAMKTEADGRTTRLALDGGADFYRAPIAAVDPDRAAVRCTIGLALGVRRGLDKHWVASDDGQLTFWRADLLDKQTFKLTGPPVTRESFGPAQALRLWEYGVGDEVCHVTHAGLRRLKPGLYELTADVDATVALRGKQIELSRDQHRWTPLQTSAAGSLVQANVLLSDLGVEGKAFLRVK